MLYDPAGHVTLPLGLACAQDSAFTSYDVVLSLTPYHVTGLTVTDSIYSDGFFRDPRSVKGYSKRLYVMFSVLATNQALSKLIVTAIFMDCRLMFLLNTLIELAEGFRQFALSLCAVI